MGSIALTHTAARFAAPSDRAEHLSVGPAILAALQGALHSFCLGAGIEFLLLGRLRIFPEPNQPIEASKWTLGHCGSWTSSRESLARKFQVVAPSGWTAGQQGSSKVIQWTLRQTEEL